MPGQHAVLSPSSAERWITCPASVQAADQIPQGTGESIYAREGTVAHALAELKGSLEFGKIGLEQFRHRRAFWRRTYAEVLDVDDVEVEMERHTDAYVELLRRELERYPRSVILFEQRLPTGMPDGGSGTSDAVVVSPEHVSIVDFKYGQGVAVEAQGNAQLRLYGAGALATFGDILGETELVRLTVHQPRLDHVLTEELTPAALRRWVEDEALPSAHEALGPNPHFEPTEAACRWCPVSGRCRAQLEAVFAEPFDLPIILTPEEMSDVLTRLPHIRDWLKAFETAALSVAYSEGTPIPGFKVVLSGGKRSWSDPDGAIAFLLEQGLTEEEVSRTSPRTLGDLEKLLGKERFAELCDPYIKPPTGSPALVPETDKRPAISPNTEAQKEFSE